jgi:ATP-dependent Zn protease
VSATTAARVDDETARIVREALEHALRLLSLHRVSLDALTQRLCDQETASGEEITELLSDAEKNRSAPEPTVGTPPTPEIRRTRVHRR